MKKESCFAHVNAKILFNGRSLTNVKLYFIRFYIRLQYRCLVLLLRLANTGERWH